MITATRFAYRFADIIVSSELELPGLISVSESEVPDVTVRLQRLENLDECTDLGRCDVPASGVLVMDLPPVARFRLSTAEREIVVETFPNAGSSALRHVVVDVALSRWLAAVGRPALHATAAALDGGVAAFLGASGRGKSTLAGALVASGATWVADDLLLLDHVGPEIVAIPTVVSTRLRTDAADALGVVYREGEFIAGGDAKRRWDVRAATQPHQLVGMFFLDRRPETDGSICVTPLSNTEAFEELATHWLLTSTGIVDPQVFFATTTRLLQTTPMLRLSYPSSFEALPSVVARIRAEIEDPRRHRTPAS